MIVFLIKIMNFKIFETKIDFFCGQKLKTWPIMNIGHLNESKVRLRLDLDVMGKTIIGRTIVFIYNL